MDTALILMTNLTCIGKSIFDGHTSARKNKKNNPVPEFLPKMRLCWQEHPRVVNVLCKPRECQPKCHVYSVMDG